MNKLFAKRGYRGAPASVLALCMLLGGCSKSGERLDSPGKPFETPPGWQTICLDRLLIDLPANVEVGGTDADSEGSYGFDGILDIGGKGVRLGKVTLSESVPTDSVGYKSFYYSANNKVTTRARYRAWFKEQEAEIRYTESESKKGTAEEMAAAKLRLAEKISDLGRSHYGLKVSGGAKLANDNAFAFRSGDNYSLGYLDKEDRRVRLFEGPISDLKLESPDAAATEFRHFQRVHHRRAPTDIPTVPGFCTAFGMLDELEGPELDTTMEIPFRSLKYPNLFFILTVETPFAEGPRNIQDMPRMNEQKADLHLIGVKKRYGPVAENILGTPGRSVGHVYGPNCSETSCRPPDQDYEIEAETYGVPGRADQPRLRLHMIAATSDDYRLKLPAVQGNPSYNKPGRPALSGHVSPPFEEGKKIFEQVLHSIRLRPGAIAIPASAGKETSSGHNELRK